jgi:hypothetical protein
LVSRRGNVYKSWPYLSTDLAHAVRCQSAALDGESGPRTSWLLNYQSAANAVAVDHAPALLQAQTNRANGETMRLAFG